MVEQTIKNMDKPLSNIDKDNDVGKDDKISTSSPINVAYTPESSDKKIASDSYSTEISYKNWEDSKKNLRWDSTPQGRAVIRLFSRGGLGAAAFTFGSWYAGRGVGMKGYESTLKFSEISPTKPLQYIAKSIDVVFGNSIKNTAKLFGKSEEAAENMVRFRPTVNIRQGVNGRSLGHESVSITFDFFCSSVGDAIGRDIANILDSNVKHTWKGEKGQIKYTEAAKTFGKSLWRYVSYNGGEDWAVAVPYAYYMLGQRKLINHFSPGFRLDNERGLNGGSKKIDKDGNVIGNYNAAGILDLQGRFTAYNVGTLMYRELYNHIDNKIHGRASTLYGSLEDAGKKQGILADIGDFFKWTARSAVKGTIYMTPAVPFFSMFRTPQSNYKGLFINPETNSVLSYKGSDGNYDAVHANEMRRSHGKFKPENGLPTMEWRSLENNGVDFKTIGNTVQNFPLGKEGSAAYTKGDGNYILNKIGQGQNFIRSKVNDIPQNLGFTSPSKRNMDNYINAAFAYTPYMYAKGEAARLWDTGKMDTATERMIDGAASLNLGEFKAGASEVWQSIIRKPFSDPKREIEAKKRILEDISPADNLTKEQAQIHKTMEADEQPLSWQQRIIHGAPPEKHIEQLKTEKRSSYLEQEAMRKALSELQPPTNSIH